jgi:hypothetical protein
MVLQRICAYRDVFDRYSNTLLVFLNNRISIREAATPREVSIKSPVATFAVAPLSRDSTDTIAINLPATHNAVSLADDEEHEMVAIHQ